jgi:hypothetical protein
MLEKAMVLLKLLLVSDHAEQEYYQPNVHLYILYYTLNLNTV